MAGTKRRSLPVLPRTPKVTLPPHAARWVDGALGELPEGEPLATCDDCAMQPPPGEVYDPDKGHVSKMKCCTYTPSLPNFLVGALLSDADPALAEGRRRVEARIARGAGVSPLGVLETWRDDLLGRLSETRAFGNAEALVCPYFDDGACTVWRYRNAVCMSWFCKHERGALGSRFWVALRRLVETVETTLARHCLVALDVPAEVVEPLLAARPIEGPGALRLSDLDGRETGAARARAWGRWAGREAELFRAAADLVGAFTWDDVVRVGGPDVRLAARVAVEAHRKRKTWAVPERLKVGTFRVGGVRGEVAEIGTYSPFDPAGVPLALLGHLGVFDGKPTRRALRELARAGLDVDEATLRTLVDYGILEPA